MSIPEVDSKNRLIAFLKKFFVFHNNGKISETLKIATTDRIALSASAASVTVEVNTVKALGKYPLAALQTEDNGYGLDVNRSGSGTETYPLIYGIDENPLNNQPVLRIDQGSDYSVGGTGGDGNMLELRGVTPWAPYSTTVKQDHFTVAPNGAIGLSLNSYNTTPAPEYKIDMKVSTYFDPIVFVAAGGGTLNDMEQMAAGTGWETAGAATAGNYRVEIDGTGITPETFRYSQDGGSTWASSGVNITTGWQGIGQGIYIRFGADTGHAKQDYWDVTPNIVPPMRIRNADGTEILKLANDGGLEVTDLDVSNIITAPTQPCVAAHLHSNQSITDGLYHPVLFDDDGTLDFDVGLDYHPGIGEFTAPADGKYLFMTNVWFGDVPSNTILVVALRTTQSVAVGYTLYSYEYLGGTSRHLDRGIFQY